MLRLAPVPPVAHRPPSAQSATPNWAWVFDARGQLARELLPQRRADRMARERKARWIGPAAIQLTRPLPADKVAWMQRDMLAMESVAGPVILTRPLRGDLAEQTLYLLATLRDGNPDWVPPEGDRGQADQAQTDDLRRAADQVIVSPARTSNQSDQHAQGPARHSAPTSGPVRTIHTLSERGRERVRRRAIRHMLMDPIVSARLDPGAHAAAPDVRAAAVALAAGRIPADAPVIAGSARPNEVLAPGWHLRVVALPRAARFAGYELLLGAWDERVTSLAWGESGRPVRVRVIRIPDADPSPETIRARLAHVVRHGSTTAPAVAATAGALWVATRPWQRIAIWILPAADAAREWLAGWDDTPAGLLPIHSVDVGSPAARFGRIRTILAARPLVRGAVAPMTREQRKRAQRLADAGADEVAGPGAEPDADPLEEADAGTDGGRAEAGRSAKGARLLFSARGLAALKDRASELQSSARRARRTIEQRLVAILFPDRRARDLRGLRWDSPEVQRTYRRVRRTAEYRTRRAALWRDPDYRAAMETAIRAERELADLRRLIAAAGVARKPAAVLVTADGLRRLKDERAALAARRQEILPVLAAARALGDLSENAEYQAAKEELRKIEARLRTVDRTLARAQVMAVTSEEHAGAAALGSRVRFRWRDTRKEMIVELRGYGEADPEAGRITYDSPVGRALMGRRAGETATVEIPAALGAPARLREIEILEVSAPQGVAGA